MLCHSFCHFRLLYYRKSCLGCQLIDKIICYEGAEIFPVRLFSLERQKYHGYFSGIRHENFPEQYCSLRNLSMFTVVTTTGFSFLKIAAWFSLHPYALEVSVQCAKDLHYKYEQRWYINMQICLPSSETLSETWKLIVHLELALYLKPWYATYWKCCFCSRRWHNCWMFAAADKRFI